VFDTNVLLDWLLKRDPVRSAAINRLLASGRRFIVLDAAIVEFVFALEKIYRFPRADVVKNLTTLLDDPRLLCDQTLLRPAVTDFATHTSLSLVDCYLMRGAETHHTPLWTFDKKLVNQSGGRARLLK